MIDKSQRPKTKDRSIEDLTHPWAEGPANLMKSQISPNTNNDFILKYTVENSSSAKTMKVKKSAMANFRISQFRTFERCLSSVAHRRCPLSAYLSPITERRRSAEAAVARKVGARGPIMGPTWAPSGIPLHRIGDTSRKASTIPVCAFLPCTSAAQAFHP